MMSSRLFLRIREKQGLCYFIRSTTDLYRTVGTQSSQAGIDPKNLIRTLKAILKEYQILKTQEVPAEELAKTKEYMKGKLTLSLEDSEGQASFFGYQWALGERLQTPEQIMKEIDSVSAADILKIANKYFTPETLSVAVVSPEIDEAKIKVELNSFK